MTKECLTKDGNRCDLSTAVPESDLTQILSLELRHLLGMRASIPATRKIFTSAISKKKIQPRRIS
jgi:hypothetical protein